MQPGDPVFSARSGLGHSSLRGNLSEHADGFARAIRQKYANSGFGSQRASVSTTQEGSN